LGLRFDDVEGVEDFGSGLGLVAGMFKIVALTLGWFRHVRRRGPEQIGCKRGASFNKALARAVSWLFPTATKYDSDRRWTTTQLQPHSRIFCWQSNGNRVPTSSAIIADILLSRYKYIHSPSFRLWPIACRTLSILSILSNIPTAGMLGYASSKYQQRFIQIRPRQL
jgi:hypothetical protein